MSAAAAAAAAGTPMLTEIPSSLKTLARLVIRGFYLIEDALIIDMLVRYPCLREDDLCELLKFDKKLLRSKIASLKLDKFVQTKHRIETGDDGKVVKMNCYFINFKTLVNIVKYKLDHMRKKMELSERDATSRASFKCQECDKAFTDLEFKELLDMMTGTLRCTFCSGPVEEDEAAGPKQDSRQLLAKFNTQMEKLYELLRLVEDVRLADSVLEPDPVHFESNQKGDLQAHEAGRGAGGGAGGEGNWSGEATRKGGLLPDSQQVKITFGESESRDAAAKEVPVWISESTVAAPADADADAAPATPLGPTAKLADDDDEDDDDVPKNDEITSLLLRHEKSRSAAAIVPDESDESDDSDAEAGAANAGGGSMDAFGAALQGSGLGLGSDDEADDDAIMSDDDDDEIPMVKVGDEEVAVTDVNEEIIARMSADEKEKYTQVFQDFYAHMYD